MQARRLQADERAALGGAPQRQRGLQEGAHDVADGRGVLALAQRLQARHPFLGNLAAAAQEHGFVQAVFRSEVVADQRLRYLGLVGHIAQGRAGVAQVGEAVFGRIQDFFPQVAIGALRAAGPRVRGCARGLGRGVGARAAAVRLPASRMSSFGSDGARLRPQRARRPKCPISPRRRAGGNGRAVRHSGTLRDHAARRCVCAVGRKAVASYS